MRPVRPLLLLGLLVAAPAVARTPSIYINDVKVDGLTGQTLSNVDLVFDDKGDLHITAKGYKITAVEEPPSASAAAASKGDHHVYIATVQPPGRSGMAQWDIDVYVNQVFVKKFQSKDPDPLVEISRFIKPGSNVIHFTARREEGEHRSASASDFFELVVGDGEMRAGQVMLNKLTSYRRTAAESGVFNSEIVVELSAAR